jgi:hypothetical protein
MILDAFLAHMKLDGRPTMMVNMKECERALEEVYGVPYYVLPPLRTVQIYIIHYDVTYRHVVHNA